MGRAATRLQMSPPSSRLPDPRRRRRRARSPDDRTSWATRPDARAKCDRLRGPARAPPRPQFPRSAARFSCGSIAASGQRVPGSRDTGRTTCVARAAGLRLQRELGERLARLGLLDPPLDGQGDLKPGLGQPVEHPQPALGRGRRAAVAGGVPGWGVAVMRFRNGCDCAGTCLYKLTLRGGDRKGEGGWKRRGGARGRRGGRGRRGREEGGREAWRRPAPPKEGPKGDAREAPDPARAPERRAPRRAPGGPRGKVIPFPASAKAS